jgi:sugar-specific transcriptional regulator TrmB
MHRRIRDLLQAAGLHEEEVQLYLLLLRKRRATMPTLVAESGLKSMTAYRTVRSLRERGLVQAKQINNKQSVFLPLTLSGLIDVLAKEQRRLRKLQIALQGMDAFLPYIGTKKNEEEELVEVREGVEAFREEYLRMPDLCEHEYLHLGSMDNYWSIARMSDDTPEEAAFRAKRYRKNIFARVINVDTPVMRDIAKRDSQELRTLRLNNAIPITRDYMAFADDRVVHFICDPDHPRSIVIRHPELIALHRSVFASLWEGGGTA